MATRIFSTPAVLHGGTHTLEDWAVVTKELHDELISIGLVDTGDSGQLDFGALQGPLNAGETIGFRTYQLNDGRALPLFLKIVFGVAGGAGGVSRANFRIVVSISVTGTDGEET